MRQAKFAKTQIVPILKEVDAAYLVNSDNGCRLTVVAFMETCASLGIRQTCTSYNIELAQGFTEWIQWDKEVAPEI